MGNLSSRSMGSHNLLSAETKPLHRLLSTIYGAELSKPVRGRFYHWENHFFLPGQLVELLKPVRRLLYHPRVTTISETKPLSRLIYYRYHTSHGVDCSSNDQSPFAGVSGVTRYLSNSQSQFAGISTRQACDGESGTQGRTLKASSQASILFLSGMIAVLGRSNDQSPFDGFFSM